MPSPPDPVEIEVYRHLFASVAQDTGEARGIETPGGGGRGRPLSGPAVPRVSVLLPVRDGMRFLPEAAGSVLDQTLADLEVVAIDDGSTDGSGEWLDARAQGEPRLRVLHTPPLGVAEALALAAAAARSPLLARMDADDVSHPERLARQVDWLDARPEVDLAACRAEPIGGGSGTRRLFSWQNGLLSHEQMVADLFVDAPFPHDAVVVRAEALRRAGGYRAVPWPEDFDLWHRLVRAGGRLGKLPEVLLGVRDHPDRVTRTRAEASQAAMLRARVHYLLAGPLAARRRVVVWGAGKVGKRLVRALQAEGVEVVAIVDLHPRKLGRVIHGAPCVPPERLPEWSELPVLAAVGKPGGREDIRCRCSRMGLPPPLAVA